MRKPQHLPRAIKRQVLPNGVRVLGHTPASRQDIVSKSEETSALLNVPQTQLRYWADCRC